MGGRDRKLRPCDTSGSGRPAAPGTGCPWPPTAAHDGDAVASLTIAFGPCPGLSSSRSRTEDQSEPEETEKDIRKPHTQGIVEADLDSTQQKDDGQQPHHQPKPRPPKELLVPGPPVPPRNSLRHVGIVPRPRRADLDQGEAATIPIRTGGANRAIAGERPDGGVLATGLVDVRSQ